MKAHIDAFEQDSAAVRAAIAAVLDDAHALLPKVTAAKAALGACNVSVALLRRNAEDPEFIGPLNSVSAVQQRHHSLAAALEDFNMHLLRLFDIERDIRLLHPSVVSALNEKAEPKPASAEPAP